MWLLGSFQHYGDALRELYSRYPADIVDVSFRSRMWGELGQIGEFTDEWGVRWSKSNPNYFGQPVAGPLQRGWDALATLRFPDAKAAWRFDTDGILNVIRENPGRFIRAYAGNLFELAQWLRGTENLLVDLYDDRQQESLDWLLDAITSYNLETIERWADFPVDGVWFMDDWGTNSQLFVSPTVWRRFFKPRYARIIERIHQLGLPAEMHSDGFILDIIPDLIEVGLDVLNPQHNVIGNEKVRDLCYGRICIRSDIDCQQILPRGTPENVRRHVQEVIECFKHPAGGLILHGEVELGAPFENYQAMYQAFAEYGTY